MRSLLIAMALFLLAASAQAFPLETTDGIVKIYGMIPTSDGFALDIFSPYELQGRGIASNLKVDIVDSEDRFIRADHSEDVSNPGYNDRALYFFEFDQPVTQIKRVRIETPNQDVYSISWSGVPEASTKNITIKLYGVKDNSRENAYGGLINKQYDFEPEQRRACHLHFLSEGKFSLNTNLFSRLNPL